MMDQSGHPPPSGAYGEIASQVKRLGDELADMKTTNQQAIASAVEAGILRAVSNPDLYAAASAAIQAQAKTRAGGWLLGWLSEIFSRLGWFIMIGVAVYTLGGWTAVVALIKSLASGPAA